jgi:hypothetical protein
VTSHITNPNFNAHQPLLTLWSTKGIKGRGGAGWGIRLSCACVLAWDCDWGVKLRQLCGNCAVLERQLRQQCGFGAVLVRFCAANLRQICGKFVANLWQLCGFAASTKQNYQTFLCDENNWTTVLRRFDDGLMTV